ncbi:MAG: SDR family NAD(P)-dependent oxidoreductase, partial [Alphaproteobacteria bacterium]|nr:SDR family NAD(P)-dependent oxidoreductase [Alphaproteobacteria bacterium]
RVLAAARRTDRLEALAARLGPRCRAVALDVAEDASVSGLLERLPAEWRQIDILVNNAAHDVGGKVPFDEGALGDWLSIIETNVAGMMRVTRAVLPGMLASGGGQIVNIGSTSGIAAIPNDAAYIASKHAVNGFSKALRLDYLGKIRVIEILPGIVRTGFAEARWRGDAEKAAAFYDGFATCLEPDDVAGCAVFALSQPANVTIAELLVVPSA